MNKVRIHLKELAFARSGDKGDVSNIGLLAVNAESYRVVKKEVTPERMRQHFKGMVKGDITVYPMDNINALEIVLRNALDGGATRTLRLDQTGKSMCGLLQRMEIEVDEAVVERAREDVKQIFKRYEDW